MSRSSTYKTIYYVNLSIIMISFPFIGYFGYQLSQSPVEVDFDYPQVAHPGEEVTFKNTSSTLDPTAIWTWKFGDFSDSVSSVSAKHSFPVPGRYIVTLQLNKDGEVYTKQGLIQINQPSLKSSFDISAPSVTVGDTLVISNNSVNATRFIWQLGDGRTLEEKSPVISYKAAGTYEVRLLALNDIGQKDEYAIMVEIVSNNVASTIRDKDEVIVKHIPIFNQQSLSEAFNKLANTDLSRSEKRSVRNDILRDVVSIEIMVNDLSLENYLNKIQLEASSKKVSIAVSGIERDMNNKILKISVN